MYMDEETERDNLLLARDPSTITDERLLAKYWHLRRMMEEKDDEDGD